MEFHPPDHSFKGPIMRHFLAAAFFAFLLVNGTDFARGAGLENVPLKWTPTSTLSEMGAIDISGALLTTKIQLGALVDTRQNPSLVGENREKADKSHQMTTSDDVAAFVTDHLKQSLRGAGLNIVDSGADVSISGEIRQFFVAEMNTYNGEISLLIHVKNSAGKELWAGVVTGDSSHWGRSNSAANYYETMSDMLLRVTYNLLANSGFREALGKR
jgi:hypothetical protein